MIRLEEMDRDELLGVVRMKDMQIRELKAELAAWQQLVDELQQKADGAEVPFSGNGD